MDKKNHSKIGLLGKFFMFMLNIEIPLFFFWEKILLLSNKYSETWFFSSFVRYKD